jgi:hypothetical protein
VDEVAWAAIGGAVSSAGGGADGANSASRHCQKDQAKHTPHASTNIVAMACNDEAS